MMVLLCVVNGKSQMKPDTLSKSHILFLVQSAVLIYKKNMDPKSSSKNFCFLKKWSN